MMRSLLLILSVGLHIAAARSHGSHGLPQLPRRRGSSAPIGHASRRFIAAFGSPKYWTDKYIPSDVPGVVLKVPNFDALFDEIKKVSPLAKQALTEDNPGGIKSIDGAADVYQWKETDNTPNRLVSHIDKIDNFQNKGVPIVRVRSTLHGPAKRRAESFSDLISDLDLRRRWDISVANVETNFNAGSFDEVAKLQEYKYGTPTLFGIGYVRTKQSVVSPREQLTLCGVQNFPSGSSIVWGIELEEDQNHLFPADQPKRTPRSTSHLWSTTFIPTGEDTFDVEYVLQLEIGGFPGWLTGPIIIETVKKLFRFADGYFKGGLDGGELAQRLALFPEEEEGPADSTDNAEGAASKDHDESAAVTNNGEVVSEELVESTVVEGNGEVMSEDLIEMEVASVTADEQAPTRRRKRDRIKDLLRRAKH